MLPKKFVDEGLGTRKFVIIHQDLQYQLHYMYYDDLGEVYYFIEAAEYSVHFKTFKQAVKVLKTYLSSEKLFDKNTTNKNCGVYENINNEFVKVYQHDT